MNQIIMDAFQNSSLDNIKKNVLEYVLNYQLENHQLLSQLIPILPFSKDEYVYFFMKYNVLKEDKFIQVFESLEVEFNLALFNWDNISSIEIEGIGLILKYCTFVPGNEKNNDSLVESLDQILKISNESSISETFLETYLEWILSLPIQQRLTLFDKILSAELNLNFIKRSPFYNGFKELIANPIDPAITEFVSNRFPQYPEAIRYELLEMFNSAPGLPLEFLRLIIQFKPLSDWNESTYQLFMDENVPEVVSLFDFKTIECNSFSPSVLPLLAEHHVVECIPYFAKEMSYFYIEELTAFGELLQYVVNHQLQSQIESFDSILQEYKDALVFALKNEEYFGDYEYYPAVAQSLIDVFGEDMIDVIYNHLYFSSGKFNITLCELMCKYERPETFQLLLEASAYDHYHDHLSSYFLELSHPLKNSFLLNFYGQNYRNIQIVEYWQKNKIYSVIPFLDYKFKYLNDGSSMTKTQIEIVEDLVSLVEGCPEELWYVYLPEVISVQRKNPQNDLFIKFISIFEKEVLLNNLLEMNDTVLLYTNCDYWMPLFSDFFLNENRVHKFLVDTENYFSYGTSIVKGCMKVGTPEYVELALTIMDFFFKSNEEMKLLECIEFCQSYQFSQQEQSRLVSFCSTSPNVVSSVLMYFSNNPCVLENAGDILINLYSKFEEDLGTGEEILLFDGLFNIGSPNLRKYVQFEAWENLVNPNS